MNKYQAGTIVDGTIDVSKLKDDVGRKLDITNNPSISNRYTKTEVDTLIAKNGLPKDWGGLNDSVEDDDNIVAPTLLGHLPISDVMVCGEFKTSETDVLNIKVQDIEFAKGEFNTLEGRLDDVDSKINDVDNKITDTTNIISSINSKLSNFEVITVDNVGDNPITILDSGNHTGIYLIFLAGAYLDTPKSLYVATFIGNYGNFVTPLSVGNGIAGFANTSLEAQVSGKTVTIKRSGSSTQTIPRVHCHVYKVLY